MKKIRKFLCAIMCIPMLLCSTAFAETAEETAEAETQQDSLYSVGDKMEDFTAVLCDGTSVTLGSLLENKKAVLINFWATWCGPCRSEFPYMQEAYDEYEDKMAIVALSVEQSDTDEAIAEFMTENELTTLPMGQDKNGLRKRFSFDGIPTSVMVDRFGTICWMETGSITSTEKFAKLFEFFTSDEYTESRLDYEKEALKPTVEPATSEELSEALNAEGGTLVFENSDDPQSWPFLPGDNGQIVSVNAGEPGTIAEVITTINAEQGEVLCFDYRTDCSDGNDYLALSVNGEMVDALSGEHDWTTYSRVIEEAGEYTLTFSYVQGEDVGDEAEDVAELDNVRIMNGEDAAELIESMPQYPHALEGKEHQIDIRTEGTKQVEITDDSGFYESQFEDAPVYLIPADTAEMKITIGAEINPNLAVVMGDCDTRFICLSNAEYDEEAYYVSIPLAKIENGEYSNTYFYFWPDYINAPDDYQIMYFYANEENLNYFTQKELPEYGGSPESSWKYSDGTKPSTNEPAVLSDETVSSDEAAEYTINITDKDNKPVADVKIQICDEETCELVVSDENGQVTFSKTPYAYTVHILAVPDGYSCDPSAEYTLPEEGGVLDIELR